MTKNHLDHSLNYTTITRESWNKFNRELRFFDLSF